MRRTLSLDEALGALPPASLPLVESVLEVARRRGVRVYLVGGPVRDLLLDREIRDVDLIIESPSGEPGAGRMAAAEVAYEAAPEGARIREYGRFGTVHIECANGELDLASARRECYSRPGALPEVEAGSLEEDLSRRDFSVNALALCLSSGLSSGPTRANRDETLPVIDVANGLVDLEARKLRILHPASFHDDPTRVLRAARLAPRIGMSLTRGTRSALRDALRDGVFGAVSGDRLRREIRRCFDDARLGLDPVAALRLLDEWHVLTAVEPDLELPREAVTSLRRLGRNTARPAWRGGRPRPWVAGLSLWLAPQSPALRRRALRRFSVRGDLAGRIEAFAKTRDARLGELAKAHGRGAVDGLLSGIDEEQLQALFASAPPAIRRRITRWAAEDRARRAPISGSDLVELGLSGAAVGRALARIRSAYLDAAVANREEARALARELARPGSRGGRGGRKAPVGRA